DHSDVAEMSLGIGAENIGDWFLCNVPLDNLPEGLGSLSLRGHLLGITFPTTPIVLPPAVRCEVLLESFAFGFEHVLVAPESAAVEIDAVQIESDAVGQLSHLLLICLCAHRRPAQLIGSGIRA